MSYIKQNFVNGDVLTAEELNAMDNQIARNEENIASVSDPTVAFTDASDRTALTTGTKLSVLMGRISKWLKDLKNAAFCDVANNDTTTDAGYVADARIVKTHGDEIDALSKVKRYVKWFDGSGQNNYVEIETRQGEILEQYPTMIAQLNTHIPDGTYVVATVRQSDTVVRIYFNKVVLYSFIVSLIYSVV